MVFYCNNKTHTAYFIIIWSLRPRAAALHHVLPPLVHNSIQVGEVSSEVLRRTRSKAHSKSQWGVELHDNNARPHSITMDQVQWISPEQTWQKMEGPDPLLTRGSDVGQLALKLFSQEEATGLLLILSTCNDNMQGFRRITGSTGGNLYKPPKPDSMFGNCSVLFERLIFFEILVP